MMMFGGSQTVKCGAPRRIGFALRQNFVGVMPSHFSLPIAFQNLKDASAVARVQFRAGASRVCAHVGISLAPQIEGLSSTGFSLWVSVRAPSRTPQAEACATKKSNRAGIYLLAQVGDEFGKRPGAEVSLALVAHRDGAGFGFLASDDQHVGDLLHLRVANFRLQFFVAVIEMYAEAGRSQFGGNIICIYGEFFAEWQNFRLHRRKPHGKRPRVMLDQDAEETLD